MLPEGTAAGGEPNNGPRTPNIAPQKPSRNRKSRK